MLPRSYFVTSCEEKFKSEWDESKKVESSAKIELSTGLLAVRGIEPRFDG